MPPLSPLPRPRPPPTDRSSHRIPLRQEAARPARRHEMGRRLLPHLRGDAPPRRSNPAAERRNAGVRLK
ncbi:hypothetical protein DAI22_01g400600 [Oryza sativa Japonica Group]|nr:hypothetical protein DAI22_01g400600 [Oryza sativa Japonica Group]